jgi:hypothetical protein
MFFEGGRRHNKTTVVKVKWERQRRSRGRGRAVLESGGGRGRVTSKYKNCGDFGHNSRSCKEGGDRGDNVR